MGVLVTDGVRLNKSRAPEDLRLTERFCRQVAARDPLRADALLSSLPEMNARADLPELTRALRALISAYHADPPGDTVGRLAAMRDIGMLLGSLKRHGVEPLAAVPEARGPLLALGAATDMVPRDTVLHYGPWNPTGARQRMFVGAREETVLIDAVRRTAPAIEDATLALAGLAGTDVADPAFAVAGRRAVARLEVLPEVMRTVGRVVDPARFFAARLRPFMEDVEVDGRRYYGPAAAHVPLHLLDRVVWSADHGDAVHSALQDDLIDYGLPAWRRLYARDEGRETLVTRVVRAVREAGGAGPELLPSVEVVSDLLRVLIVFRGRHSPMVKAAYTDNENYCAGSAGASPDVVRHILELTRRCAEALRSATGRHG
ncbi:protein of unknown function (DUF1864) [Streptoalloteichus tenebrarius]|uniref:Uncharacterized protein n=2 Tax=Streptoalloteichus tenebrarius (strain ATCC 17920 / DSM 40477 / JCM 4838 / CBS 697.72 / NBRC 16177 / NCIMB 11028 / NRRL B-12390 / A12253. 1 / ISP 5477) TaxID=1933 RepID=A0ABT1I1V7_STRSD|nr:protein of unknown function (DUF1864) [Streptoalloteichus tenebrarius]